MPHRRYARAHDDARADLVSPTYVPDLVHEVLNLLIDGATGLWHLANTGAVSWYDFARMAAERAGYDPELVTQNDEGGIVNTALDSERGLLLPSFDSAFDRFFNDSEISWSAEDTLSVAAE